MKSTAQLLVRKAWLEAQHVKVCAELRARGVEVPEAPKKAAAKKATKKAAAKPE